MSLRHQLRAPPKVDGTRHERSAARFTAHRTRTMPSQRLRMDTIGIVVESLDDAVAVFTELGLT